MKKRVVTLICAGAAAAAMCTAVIAASIKAEKLSEYANLIDIKTAIDAAVDETGLYSDEVYVVKAELDREKGVPIYEIEIATENGKAEYDINALDASVVKSKNMPVKNSGTAAKPVDPQNITVEQAKAAACRHAGVKEADIVLKKAKLDREDGQYIYEIEFYASNMEYEYEISVVDGSIVECQSKVCGGHHDVSVPGSGHHHTSVPGTDISGKIGVEEAKAIAFKHANVNANNVWVEKAKLDNDDGRAVYEIEFYTSTREYEYEIDAESGKIIDWDAENRD